MTGVGVRFLRWERTEIGSAYLQVIVVGTLYGIDCTGCTTAVRHTRIVACENKHRQTTTELKTVAAYTELEGVQPRIDVKKEITRLSFFDKDRTLWIASGWSTWWLRSKILASCGCLTNHGPVARPTRPGRDDKPSRLSYLCGRISGGDCRPRPALLYNVTAQGADPRLHPAILYSVDFLLRFNQVGRPSVGSNSDKGEKGKRQEKGYFQGKKLVFSCDLLRLTDRH